MEFPKEGNYVPFLDTEIRIGPNGDVSTRYYRKPQNKGITLNYNSHHELSMKQAVAKNYYRTAEEVSSGPAELQHSLLMVDDVLIQNNYPTPRTFKEERTTGTKKKKNSTKLTTLCLPYISEGVSNKIRNHVKSNDVPVKLIFTPGKTLKQLFTNSRPFDRTVCCRSNPDRCDICPLISNGGCNTRGAIYQVTCCICPGEVRYQGETERPLYHRIKEHLRAARNPATHPNNAIGQHHADKHPGSEPQVTVAILDCKRKTVERKMSEALYIHKHNPELNEKSELESVVKFIV